MAKKIYQTIILLTLVFASFAGASKVAAWSGCGSTYTVQWGNTLSGIAANCGTSVYAIQMANPGLGSWVYAGQLLQMPGGSWGHNDHDSWNTGGSYPIHIVAYGDTLKNIAYRYGTSMDAIANLNGIYNYSLIYVGQRLQIPSGGYVPQPPPPHQPNHGGATYTIQSGDTIRKLAARWGVTTPDIMAANPQIANASLIYVGQVIYKPGYSTAPTNPGYSGYYTVRAGDSLRTIANMYGTSVYNLQLLNPQIGNPNWIYAGMVIRVQ